MVLKISSKFELRRFCRTTGAIAMVRFLASDNVLKLISIFLNNLCILVSVEA